MSKNEVLSRQLSQRYLPQDLWQYILNLVKDPATTINMFMRRVLKSNNWSLHKFYSYVDKTIIPEIDPRIPGNLTWITTMFPGYLRYKTQKYFSKRARGQIPNDIWGVNRFTYVDIAGYLNAIRM